MHKNAKNNLSLTKPTGLGFCNEHALILYVYLNSDDDGQDGSVLTVRLTLKIDNNKTIFDRLLTAPVLRELLQRLSVDREAGV